MGPMPIVSPAPTPRDEELLERIESIAQEVERDSPSTDVDVLSREEARELLEDFELDDDDRFDLEDDDEFEFDDDEEE